MPSRHLRFELYSIHGHLESGTLDYVKFFTAVAHQLSGIHYEEGPRHIAVGRSIYTGQYLFLLAYTGYSEKSILFFDVNTQSELHTATEAGKFQARKTHALIAPRQRLLLIESRRGHLHPDDLADILESIAKQIPEFSTLELSFNPVVDEDFLKQIDQLKRVQSATISLARPNVDWTDRHHQLTEVASESDAKALDVTVRSKRGKSLAKDAGLIEFIKQFAGLSMSVFKRISITGSRDDDAGLITLNLSKHIQHLDTVVETDPVPAAT